MITVIATIVVLGILIFVHEFGHFLLAKLLGVKVQAFSLGFPPKLISKTWGETEYRLSVIPLGGYVKLLGENPDDEVAPEEEHRSFSHHPLWHRALIVLAGPGFNLLFAVLALSLTFAISGIPYLIPKVGEVMPDSPAAQAGLKKDDLVTAIDGKTITRWEELVTTVRLSAERPLALAVKRGEAELTLTITPKRMETTNIFGQKVSAVLIGVASSEHYAVDRVNPLTAFTTGAAYTGRIVEITVLSLWKLLTQEIPITTLGGPILIAQVAGKQAEQGINSLVHFMALLSVNLTLLNLLPIPILDGGHLVFILWEAVRGKPLAMKHREMAQALGLMLILALMVVVFYQDLQRLFSGGQ
jgi:regulator of sigma E protease